MSETANQVSLDEKSVMSSLEKPVQETLKHAAEDGVDAGETPAKKVKLDNDVVDGNDQSEIPLAPVEKKTPGRKPGSKKSTLEKMQQESAALLKTMGHTDESGDDPSDGARRKTRSQTKGTPAPPPKVVKTPKEKTPKVAKTPSDVTSSGTEGAATPKRRGRPPKNAAPTVATPVETNNISKADDKKSKAADKKKASQETNNKEDSREDVTANNNNSEDNNGDENDDDDDSTSGPAEAPEQHKKIESTPVATNDTQVKKDAIKGSEQTVLPTQTPSESIKSSQVAPVQSNAITNNNGNLNSTSDTSSLSQSVTPSVTASVIPVSAPVHSQ